MIELTSHVSGGTLYFYANTHSAAGVATDADSVPSYRIYLQENGTAVATGSMAKLDDANTTGFYSEAVAMAGYDPGEYACYISATVGGVVATKSFPFVVGIGSGPLLVRTTIATLASQTSFTLTGGPVEDDAINDSLVIVRDAASVDQFCVGYVEDYAGATKAVALAANPGIFTMAVGDSIEVYAPVGANLIAVRSSKQSAIDLRDFADDGYDPATNKVQGVVLVDTLTTYTGNTVQTGDSFPRIGAAGAGLTAIDLPDQTMNITGTITGNLSGSVGSVTGAVGSVTADVGVTQAGADKVWASAARTLTSFGTLIADIWAAVTRTLSAGTNIVLAKGVGVTGFNDLSAAQVNAEADTALADVGLTTTVTGRVDAAVSTRAAEATLLTVAGYVDTEITAIKGTTDKLDTALELDGAVYRYTTNALEQAPSGGGGGDTPGTTTLLTRIPGTMEPQTGDSFARLGVAGVGLTNLGDARLANLDATVASRATQTSVDDLPTNAELAAALATADDAILAAITALNNLSSAQAQTAAGAALTAYTASTAAQVTAVTSTLGAALAALNDLSAAEAKAQLVAALGMDTSGEPGQGAPPEMASLVTKIAYLYKYLVNRKTGDGTTEKLYNYANSVVDQKASTSEAGGVVTKDAVVSGP